MTVAELKERFKDLEGSLRTREIRLGEYPPEYEALKAAEARKKANVLA